MCAHVFTAASLPVAVALPMGITTSGNSRHQPKSAHQRGRHPHRLAKAAKAEAAGEMQYLKDLMLSRPYFSRIPDQNLIGSAAAPRIWM